MSQTRINQPTTQSTNDVATFLYSDGHTPMAGVEFKILALGNQPGTKSDLDVDHTILSGRLPDLGQIVLNDPALVRTFDLVGNILKTKHPGKLRWEGVPGRRNPYGYSVHPDMQTDRLYPVVPLVIDVDADVHMIRNSVPQRFAFAPGTFVTTFQRFAVGGLNGNNFDDSCKYLEHLATYYTGLNLTSWLPMLGRTLNLQCTRMSEDFPLKKAYQEMGRRLNAPGATNSAASKKAIEDRNRAAARVFQELRAELSMPDETDLRQGYQRLLHQIATEACAELKSQFVLNKGPLARMTRAVARAVGADLSGPPVVAPFDDYAYLGTLVFAIGAIPHGFLRGKVSLQFSADTRGAAFVDMNTI